MTTFTLDTSGAVGPMPSGYDDPENRRGFWSFPRARYAWPDLSPFVQGYVEALFQTVVPVRDDAATVEMCLWEAATFSDLDPSALALILRDCEANRANYESGDTRERGAEFWRHRAHKFYAVPGKRGRPAFPPLQPYLSDEGRVCLREAA